MKQSLLFFVFLLPLFGCQRQAKSPGRTLYLQLVCANDSDVPPTVDSKPVGRSLRERLSATFKWKHYWELQCRAVNLQPGHSLKEFLGPDRAVELESVAPETLAVSVRSKGQCRRIRRQPAADTFYVTGGESGENQSWFIIVRQDKPQPPESY
jgi:hypothetical protein